MRLRTLQSPTCKKPVPVGLERPQRVEIQSDAARAFAVLGDGCRFRLRQHAACLVRVLVLVLVLRTCESVFMVTTLNGFRKPLEKQEGPPGAGGDDRDP